MPAIVQMGDRSLNTLICTITIVLCLLAFAPVEADSDSAIRNARPRVQQPGYSDAQLLRVLNGSGVLAQFTSIAHTVVEESRRHWRHCDVYPTGMESWITESLSAQRLTETALERFRHLLTQEELDGVTAWLESSAGQAIIEAEQSAPVLTEAEFTQLLETQYALPDYQTQRAPRIRALIDNTGSATIFTALNAELDALANLASGCTTTDESVRRIIDAAIEARKNQALVITLMRLELNAPTAVIFRNTSDAEIDAFLSFSRSSVGRAYHAALVRLVRTTLSDSLQAMAHWRMADK